VGPRLAAFVAVLVLFGVGIVGAKVFYMIRDHFAR
jgi:hypothetical protein